MAAPKIPNFFSVERKGYTKVSDVFYDVMQDMLANGFTQVNCSNALKDQPVTFWKPTVVESSISNKVGTKLYILDGTRPIYAGSTRPAPYVQVTSVNSAGNVTGVTDVIADYDFPVWTAAPTGNINLSTSNTTSTPSGVKITVANVTAISNRTTTTANVTYAPMRFSFTLEAGGNVDPLNGDTDPNSLTGETLADSAKQPWRVQFVVAEEQKVSGSVATKLQMSYDEVAGRISISQITDDYGSVIDNVGAMGAAQPGGIFTDSDLNQGFYNRKLRVANQASTFPLSYMLSITDRGFFLGVYEGSWSVIRAATSPNSNYFNWVLVQRPVDRGTGRTLTAGKAPVFHINSVNYKYYKAVVREADILHPTSGPSPLPGTGNLTIGLGSQYWTNNVAAVKTNELQSVAYKDNLTNPAIIISNSYVTSNRLSWFANLTLDTRDGSQAWWGNTYPLGTSVYDGSGNFIGTITSIPNANTLGANVGLFSAFPSKTISNTDYFTSPPNISAMRVLADVHSPDSHAIFNSTEQVSLTEDKTYLLSFPHNLTTPRFRYTEELDMVGTTSADVVMSGQDIQFKTYGESGPRTYRALPANGALNTGLRMAVVWAPQGPKWTGPNGEVSPTDLGPITAGAQPGTILTADPVPVNAGEDPRATPTFRLERGSLPQGLSVSKVGDQWQISGTVNQADYTENTVIKFTLAAVNQEDTGYSLKDFFFTYVI
jgi:hypothetical protein